MISLGKKEFVHKALILAGIYKNLFEYLKVEWIQGRGGSKESLLMFTRW